MNFSEQIKKIRVDKGITQQEMANNLGISRQAISKWENDRNLPDIEMIIKIAQVFNLTLDELILGGIDMNNMTEKLIKDGSENNRIKMNLTLVKLGIGLFSLSVIFFLAGVLGPLEMENYFGAFSSTMMFSGLITFFVVGIKNIFDVFHSKKNNRKYKKMNISGGIFMITGISLYAITISTGAFSGTWGILICFLGIICIAITNLTSKK